MAELKKLNVLVTEFVLQDQTGTLTAYVGASEATARRWRAGSCSPSGYMRLKAMHFLKKQGFSCFELEELPEQVRVLGELISDGTVLPEIAVKAIDAKNLDILLSILLGRWRCTFQRLEKIDALVASTKSAQDGEEKKRDEVIDKLATLIIEALPLAKQLLSESFSPEHRAKIRKLVGEMKFFKFSNLVDQLCGGKAVLSGGKKDSTNNKKDQQ